MEFRNTHAGQLPQVCCTRLHNKADDLGLEDHASCQLLAPTKVHYLLWEKKKAPYVSV
jgi:hypothetical protein